MSHFGECNFNVFFLQCKLISNWTRKTVWFLINNINTKKILLAAVGWIHSATPRVPRFCSYHIFTSSVIYYWTDARQHGIYLFYKITKQTTSDKAFLFPNILTCAKVCLCPAFAHFGEHTKKPFDVIYDLYEMKQFYWLLCVAKNCDWSRKITPLSNLTRASLLVEWKLTAKAELNREIYKSWRKCWKNQVSCLENYRSWKTTLGKLVVAVNLETIWFEFWMKGD